MNKNEPIINLKDICFSYPGQEPVHDKLNLKLYSKDKVGLLGPNGSGKTTLFHIIMGLLKPSAGQIEIFGKDVSKEKDFAVVRQKIGLLFQDADDQLFSPTVLEDVAFGPLNIGKSNIEAQKIAMDTLDFLGLAGFEDRITHKLSGGEKKLISFATVLAMQPEFLLLDEPATALDEKTKARLIDILHELDLPCLVISHDSEFLGKTTDSIYTMKNEKIIRDADEQLHCHYHSHFHGASPHKHQKLD